MGFATPEPRPRLKVYCASKIRHAPLWRDLRAGRLSFCEIVSSWIDTEKKDETTTAPDYAHIWTRNVRDAQKADFVLLYGEDKDWLLLSGTIFEAGVAIGRKRQVIVVGYPPSNMSWIYHPNVILTESPFFDKAIEILQRSSS